MEQSAAIVANCFREMNLHVQYCAGFGISKEQMEKTEELQGNNTHFLSAFHVSLSLIAESANINVCNSMHGIYKVFLLILYATQPSNPVSPLPWPFSTRNTSNHQPPQLYRYVLDIGQSEDWFALQMALAPCLLGYGAIAKHLHASPNSKTGEDENLYWSWIANYVADDYVTAVKAGRELLERHAVLQSPRRIEELVGVFVHATKVSDTYLTLRVAG